MFSSYSYVIPCYVTRVPVIKSVLEDRTGFVASRALFGIDTADSFRKDLIPLTVSCESFQFCRNIAATGIRIKFIVWEDIYLTF